MVGKTSVHREELELPALSFCPGYRAHRVAGKGWLKPNMTFSGPRQRLPGAGPETERFWSEVNLELSQVLMEVGLKAHNGDLVTYSPSELEDGSAKCFRVEEHHTLEGKCYVLRSSCQFRKRVPILLDFNLTQIFKKSMVLNFHHPRATVGLNRDMWPAPVTSVRLSAKALINIAIRHEAKESLLTHTSREDFYDCIDGVVREHVSLVATNATAICNFPPFRSILRKAPPSLEESLPHCEDSVSFAQAYWKLFLLLYRQAFNSDCASPDNVSKYVLSSKKHYSPLMPAGTNHIMMYYLTTDVAVEREQLMMDFGNLVATVGGIAGMFLGWSILDLARIASESMRWMAKKMAERK